MTPILVTAALMADLVTARVERELNPIAAALLTAGPLAAFAAKTALVALVLAYVALVRDTRPRLARGVALVAVVAGCLGAASNL